MLRGFEGIFGDAPQVHIVVSAESATYRPEMEWLAQQLGPARFQVRDAQFREFGPGDAVYRFFELFDMDNVENARLIFDLAAANKFALPRRPSHFLKRRCFLPCSGTETCAGFGDGNLAKVSLNGS